jgi:outer membrane protein assembly factor BamB
VVVEGLARSWKSGEPKEIWRRKLGEGFGGIAVVEGRAHVLFAKGRREFLVALDAQGGEELWRLELGETLSDRTGNGPRTTPAVADGVVYALGTHWVVAVDASSGQELWRVGLGEPPQWGFSSSPLLVGDLVIFQAVVPAGGEADAEAAPVTALRRADGSVAWRAGRGSTGYSSPLFTELFGRPQVLAFVGEELLALEPESGEVLWRHPWKTSYGVNAADPVLYPPDRIFLSSGYDTGAALLRVMAEGEGFAVEELWRTRQMKNHFSSSVRHGDHLYGFDNGTLKCLDLVDGSDCWRHRGFGKGSLVLADDLLIVLGDEGTLALVEPSPERYHELGSVRALESGSWTPPSLAGRWLYLRDHREIACLDLGS